MCGVAAIFSFHSAAPSIDRAELVRIRDYMRARGPDSKGEWYSDDGRLGIGHRRLSIIDLSERGVQPMLNPSGNLVLSFNGEIYNYRSLRTFLEGQGRVFRSTTDTEVILQLYELKGEAMFDDLRGMFALVLWDQVKGRMLLARDPYGIKPLYYANDGWTVRVASQVKALLAGGRVSRQGDPAGQVGYFLFGSVPEPYTTYQEISAVPAGSIVQVDAQGPSAARVWSSIATIFNSTGEKKCPADRDKSNEIVRNAIRDTVKHHLVSDVPVGMFLSSGIDSTALVALVNEFGMPEIETITLAFSEFSGGRDDESPGAKRTAQAYGTKHTTCRVSEADFREHLPKILHAMDQPSIDGINTWMVSKQASELGLKVCLSGLGGDELFGGYPSFRQIPKWVRAMSIPSRIPLLGRLFRAGFQLAQGETFCFNPKMAEFVTYAGTYSGAYLLKRGLFLPWELPDLLGKELVVEGLRKLNVQEYIKGTIQPDPGSDFARIACLESSLYLRNQLLRDADWAGMAHSVEVRVPFVDFMLLSRVAPIAHSSFMGGGKALLASAPAKAINETLIQTQKTGFSIPMEPWISNLRNTLDAWRSVPLLEKDGCHWARRFAYAIHEQAAG